MHLQQLDILHYKNIREASLTFSPKLNCLVGDNGEGKTNVLDAIFFLSFTRAANHAPDALCVTHGQETMMLSGRYNLEGNSEQIACTLQVHHKKILRRGQKAYRRMSDHIGLLPLIFVSPDDTALVSGPSEDRRRFMDIVIAQYLPTYIPLLNQYNRALLQRNTLLRQLQDLQGHGQGKSLGGEEPDASLLESYEIVMAQTGEQIFAARQQFITQLEPLFRQYYQRIAPNEGGASLLYESHCQRGPLLDIIQRDRHKDLAVGYSLHGIHKDDLVMQLDGYPLRREGSQGQTKTYVVALKLAQYDFLRQACGGKRPLLLLDDLFDKLDAHRVDQIIQVVAQEHFGQIFITDTNRLHLDRIIARTDAPHRIFTVRDGEITPAH